MRQRLAFCLFACATTFLVGCRSVEKSLAPSNARDWQPQYSVLSTAEIAGDNIRVRNVRYCKYLDADTFVVDHYDRSFNIDHVRAVDFFVMPFAAVPALAHTQLSFEIVDPPRKPEYLAVSVETRKEVGEEFEPLKGTARQYELMYVLADERDTIQSQVINRDQPVYRYRSTASPEIAQELLLDILARVNKLARDPEFYDTITNNCTTNILDHVNRVVPHRVVYDYRVLLPGLSDQLAYQSGLIEQRGTFAETKRQALVNDRVVKYAGHRDFSQLIRR